LNLGEIERRFCLGKARLRRVQLRFVGTRIDDEQQLSFLQVFTVLKVPLDDPSPTCGVTVTDSKAAFLPISSKYFGTSCAVALTTVTSGAGMAGAAACTLLRLQPAVANSSAAASPSRPYRRFEVVLTVMFMAILI
jgi:hypothetical protein